MKLFHINSVTAAFRALIGWPFLAVCIYMAAALVGSHIAANGDWRSPREGVDIFVESNGVHVSLILPMAAAGEDLSDVIRPDQLADRSLYGTHAMIGWGHGAVYRNAKTWGDVKGRDVLSAIFGSNDTILHVYHLVDPRPLPYRKRLRVSVDEYHLIVSQVRSKFQLDANQLSVAHLAYGPDNLFYDSSGHYDALFTCNTWVGDVLKNAGVQVGIWTPLAGGVMRWF